MDNVIKLIDARKRRDMALEKKEADKKNQEQVLIDLIYKSIMFMREAVVVAEKSNKQN